MDVPIGQVIHYFSHIGVAVIELTGELKLGDTVIFLGHTTDFSEIVCSIEVEHRKIQVADQGMRVAIKVDEPVREGDQMMKAQAGDETLEGDRPGFQALWRQARTALGAIAAVYEGISEQEALRAGIDQRVTGLLVAALTFDPDTISPERLSVRGPYTAETEYDIRLMRAKSKGYLFEPEPGEYRLTSQGRALAEALIVEARQAMVNADPLSPQNSRILIGMLKRLVKACLEAPPPPDTWSIRLAYKLMPAETPSLPYIDQALSCLSAYRDDAHLAAWRQSGLSAPAMESLTLLWRGEASSLDGLYDKLAFRGFEKHDYRAAFQELRGKGFLAGAEDAPMLTSTGHTFREQVERETDRQFFLPWSCLAPVEKAELACLLAHLRDGLAKTTSAL
jgi:hypothetical protein